MSSPAPESESFAVARLKSADIGVLLERMNLSDLMDKGAVNVVSLDAIRDKLGERWPRKQIDIWAHFERYLQKTLAPQDIYLRLTDCDYLVAIVSDSSIAAQSLCIHILEETLVFFLGACKPTDLILQTVSGIRDGVIDCHPIDAAAVRRAAQATPATVSASQPPQRIIPTASPIINFLSVTGRELRVTHHPEPLINLRQGGHSGVRSEPTVTDLAKRAVLAPAELARLADYDLERIDQATFERAVQVTKVIHSDRAGMILPISFQTLASSRSRAALFALAPAALVRQRFLIEIVNIDAGTPNGRLIELAGLLRAHTTGVMARVGPSRAAIDVLKDIRLAGVALDLSELNTGEAAILTAMTAFYNRAVTIAPSLQVLGLPSRALFGAALKVGLTHASLRHEHPVHMAA